MLPTTKTAIMMGFARTVDSEHAERSDKRIAKRVAFGQQALKTLGRLPSLSGERYALVSPTARYGAMIEGYKITKLADRVSNDTKREFSLPRRAMSMASSRGRVTPDMVSSLMSFFREDMETLAHHLRLSFLPEKISAKEALPILERIASERRIAPPTGADVAAVIRAANPGSGHAGGRPRKVRTFTGTLSGHSRPYTSTAIVEPSVPTQVSRVTDLPAPTFGAGANDVAALLDAFHAATLRQSAEVSA